MSLHCARKRICNQNLFSFSSDFDRSKLYPNKDFSDQPIYSAIHDPRYTDLDGIADLVCAFRPRGIAVGDCICPQQFRDVLNSRSATGPNYDALDQTIKTCREAANAANAKPWFWLKHPFQRFLQQIEIKFTWCSLINCGSQNQSNPFLGQIYNTQHGDSANLQPSSVQHVSVLRILYLLQNCTITFAAKWIGPRQHALTYAAVYEWWLILW